MRDLSNASLVTGCIKGSRIAWNKFVERFCPLIFWAIKNRLNKSGYPFNQQDIEDIFQDVFVLLCDRRKLKQIKNRENISAWLAIVAANCTNSYIRNKRIDTPFSKEPLTEKIGALDCPADEVIEREQLNNTIAKLLSYLSARELIILKLNYFYEKTHQEIARLLKMPPNTVSSIIKRTKEKLKEELKRKGLEKF